jgi:hypothetical protein
MRLPVSLQNARNNNKNKYQLQIQVAVILFIISCLIFLSSFISLNHHESLFSKDTFSLNSGKRVFGNEIKSVLKTSTTLDGKKKASSGGDSETDPLDGSSSTVVGTSLPPVYKFIEGSETNPPNSKRCLIRIQPKCPVHPLVHYWDEYTDCFVSPLRAINGLAARNENRKFIVFQPDLGGWNNIRMALEVVILFAKVTGRILVLPPDAVLYLLILNKKWGENKSNMDDYFDFSHLSAYYGLETMTMKEFLETVAKPGHLSLPLPENNVELIRKPLWDYLEKACYVRQWSPGKTYIGFNISENKEEGYIGGFDNVCPLRIEEFSLKKVRQLVPYNSSFHEQRAIYFPGHEDNRLLTHYYSYLFFDTAKKDHEAKRFMRDRLRYHDEIFCVASRIIQKMLILQEEALKNPSNKKLLRKLKDLNEAAIDKNAPLDYYYQEERKKTSLVLPTYIAFHIRRGDFQQKHTRLPADEIVSLTNHLTGKTKEERKSKIAYISTDEKNRSFFQPFVDEYHSIFFLDDLRANTAIEEINQNYIGMIEQVVCVGADVFIGTPLSTFTAYITRMRGYLNRTIEIPFSTYSDTQTILKVKAKEKLNEEKEKELLEVGDSGIENRKKMMLKLDRRGIYENTLYFMKHHMYQLHTKPKVHFPLWIRDFVDVFKDIDDY